MDLQAYFDRVGFEGEAEPTLDVLRRLHLLHPQAIPFEGLDPFLGRPVAIDPASIEAKLVRRRRGGYCFEHNGILLGALRQIGFQAVPLAARVLWMLPADAPQPPLSHMLIKVDLPEGAFICDVGFGGQSPTAPLCFEPGLEQSTPHGDYRLLRAGAAFDLQMRLPDRWETMYRFTLEPQAPRDYEVYNWFTSTHPTSRFTSNLVASRVVGERRLNLLNRELVTHFADGRTERRALAGPGELRAVLTGDFGIDADQADAEVAWARTASAEDERVTA